MDVACFQFEPVFGDVAGNLARIEEGVGGRRADLVVLPELATTGYVFRNRDELATFAEPVPGPSTERLQTLAGTLDSTLCVGLAERDGSALFNSAVLVDRRGVTGRYRKVHLFDRENDWFDSGPDGFPVFDVGGVPVGIMICFDWFYPESMRTLTLNGARVIAHPANLVLPWCQRAMSVRCLENHVVAATANRVGTESRGGVSLHFTGGSQITGTRGAVLAEAPATGEAWIQAEIDTARIADRRMGTMADFLALRRPHLYGHAPA